MDRSEKLAKLKKRDGSKSNLLVVGNGQDFVEILEATVGELKSSLGNGVAINNLDDLLDQLSVLQSFQKEVKDLRDSIKAIDLPESVKIEGLDELITSIKVIASKKEVKAEKLDTAPFIDISTKVTTLIEKIESMKVPPQGQRPDDYIPTRRVMKVGNKLLYDDSFYTGGGGGGSTSDGIIKGALGGSATVTGGKLDVNATATLSGQAIPSAGATTAVTTQIVDGSGNQITSFGGGTQYADGAVRGTATGTVAMVDDGTNIQSLSGDSTGKLNVNNISGTVSLPTGAATAAKQLADGHNVVVTSAPTTAVTGTFFQATQPVSGTVTANAGTNLNTSALALDATLTGGTQKAIIRGGAKGATTAADVTSTSQSVDRNALDVQIRTSAGVVVDTFGGDTSLLATHAKQDTLLTELQAKADLTETQPVSLITVPPHAVTNAGTFATQVDGAALTSLQLIDDPIATLGTTTYTEASTKGGIIGAVRRDANTTLVDTTNEIAPLQVNATGELKVAQILALPAGLNAIGKLAANSGIDIGDVDVTSIIAGTGATNLGKAEDAVHASGDTGVMALAVQSNVSASTAATGDYHTLQTDSRGQLHTGIPHASTSTDISLASAATSAQVIAANTARTGLYLTNTDVNDCHIYFGTTATTVKFSVRLGYLDTFIMPAPIWTGRIDAIWAVDGSGSLIGSELAN